MNQSDAAKVLAVAATYDARLKPASMDDTRARATAWAHALRPDMDLEWAIRQVTRHYGESTETIMPAHLNAAWRAHVRPINERLEREAVMPSEGVPMPADVKAQIHKLLRKTKEPTDA